MLPLRPSFPNSLDKIGLSTHEAISIHIYLGLRPGGRVAALFPENVLFESNVGRLIRSDLMNRCNLHTILRLQSGIFYAQG